MVICWAWTDEERTPRSAAALVVLWSSGFVGARLGTETAAATTLLAWRFLCAAAVLGLVAAGAPPADPARCPVAACRARSADPGRLPRGRGDRDRAGCAGGHCSADRRDAAAARRRGRAGADVRPATLGARGGSRRGRARRRRRPRARHGPSWAFLLPAAGTVALAAGTLLERRWRTGSAPIDGLPCRRAPRRPRCSRSRRRRDSCARPPTRRSGGRWRGPWCCRRSAGTGRTC